MPIRTVPPGLGIPVLPGAVVLWGFPRFPWAVLLRGAWNRTGPTAFTQFEMASIDKVKRRLLYF